MTAGLISDDFARRLNKVLVYVEREMRKAKPAYQLQWRQTVPQPVIWGRLLEDVEAGDVGKRMLRYKQSSDDGSWDDGLLDNGTPGTDEYEQNDVYYVDDNLLETGEVLIADTWVVVASNPQSGRWQIINWKGCVS